ncbi:g3797 [Coccomyxa elongata]
MSSTTKESLTEATFASFNLSDGTQRAITEVMGYTNCTSVQAETLPATLRGMDVVVKAKTGTGKTLAFLIPGIERMLKEPAGRGKVAMLVISPTRELAAQIAEEAKQLVRHHKLGVQVMFGGTNMNKDINDLQRRAPDVLVATPGRLLDHLQNTETLRPLLSNLRMLVLDEADRLLDMGFRQEIEKLTRMLPPKDGRQNMLFSATYPSNIRELSKIALRPEYQLVDTVGDEDTHAAETVQQNYLITSMEDQTAHLLAAIRQHMSEDPSYKIMAFFVTARVTQFYCELFQAMGIPVLEMHSRKSQSQRTKAADQFRNSKGACIMFSSDVSARGVDYPDVTLVVQLGLPMEKAQYVHRLGRTARAGKSGKGLIILGDYEAAFLNSLSDLPITEAPRSSADTFLGVQEAVEAGLAAVQYESKAQAYRTWLGFYKGFLKMCKWTPERLVQAANQYAATLGCSGPPPIEKRTVGKMGMKGVPGLNIVASLDVERPGGRGGGRGGQGQGRSAQGSLRSGQSHQQPRQNASNGADHGSIDSFQQEWNGSWNSGNNGGGRGAGSTRGRQARGTGSSRGTKRAHVSPY